MSEKEILIRCIVIPIVATIVILLAVPILKRIMGKLKTIYPNMWGGERMVGVFLLYSGLLPIILFIVLLVVVICGF